MEDTANLEQLHARWTPTSVVMPIQASCRPSNVKRNDCHQARPQWSETLLAMLENADATKLRSIGEERGVARRIVLRPSSAIAFASLISVVGGVGSPPIAQADDGSYAINGTYTATSDGTYATTDYAFHNESTVRSTWAITSTCATDEQCTGRVTSDQGWSAPLRNEGHVWYVERDVPNWETCPGGATFTGHQTFMFYPANPDGLTQIGSGYLEGRDKTVGPRSACGIPPIADAPASGSYGKPLTIVMPFRLDKIG
jgi:hypothetical protein